MSAPEPPLVTPLTEETRLRLRGHVGLAARLLELSGGQPAVAARLAFRLREPVLARALLALSGSLFDTEESQRVLHEPVDELLLSAAEALAAPAQQGPAGLPWTATQQEMYIRVLAGLLLTEGEHDSHDLLLHGSGQPADPQSGVPLLAPGVWNLPALPEQERWAAALRLIRELGKQPGVRCVQWASPSWGGRWGFRRTLRQAGLSAELRSLEQVMDTLSAAWRWDLPGLTQMLRCPLLLDHSETLSPERHELLLSMLADATALFGWAVILLPAMEAPVPPLSRVLPEILWRAPLPAGRLAGEPPPVGGTSEGREDAVRFSTPAPRVSTVKAEPASATLAQLAQQLNGARDEAPARSLVVVYSRATAARLTGMVPGSVLLSSSLCRVHQEQVMNELADRKPPRLTLIATTLPSTPIGLFDRVWHVPAPLPHLVEAAQLTRSAFTLLTLRDVVTPQNWVEQVEVTREVLGAGERLNDAAAQYAYFERLRSTRDGGLDWVALRRHQQFARLASELRTQVRTSVPVLIPFDEEAQAVIERYRRSGWLPGADLRYAAWLTITEAQRAVRREEAEAVGWALIWKSSYHPQYGLAAEYVLQRRDMEA